MAGPVKGKTETLSRGSPATTREPASSTNARPQPAIMVAPRPIRSEASRMCGTAKRALNLPPAAQRRSTAVAPLSLTAMTARWPSILSFLRGWRSSATPRSSSSRTSPRESMSPTIRSGTIPASRAYRAPPSAATTRSARAATRRSRSGGSGAPFRKMAALKLGGLRSPVPHLARGGLRPPERPEQRHHDHERDDQARHQVSRVVHRGVDQRVPSFREGGGEEADPRDEGAEKAGQHSHDGAEDRAPRRGWEEPGEPENAEGQRVVEDQLHGVNDERLDGEVEEAVGRPGDDAYPGSLAERQQYEGHHIERDRAPERHLEDLDQTQHEGQGHGQRRLREHPRVSERIHRAPPSCSLRGAPREALES